VIDIYADLEELGLPVYAEGDAPAELPDEYITISEDSTADNLSADNQAKEIRYDYTLVFYTKRADHLYEGLLKAMALLRKKGYITSGVGYAHATYQGVWFARQADIIRIEYVNNE
jgi:hypothetical protein